MRKNITRILFGATIVIAAIFILLNAFGVIHLGRLHYWDFWPVILIILGIGAIISDKPNVWNLTLTGLGIFFFCLEMGWIKIHIAVSYTHLDVYKRQMYSCLLRRQLYRLWQ